MDVRWVAVAVTLTIGGIGVLMKVSDGSLQNKKVWGTLGTFLIFIGLAIGVGTILTRFHGEDKVADDMGVPSVERGGNQTMTDSPGGVQVQGDNNTINRGSQDRRIKKEDEFIQAMRAVGPVAVRLNTVDGREPEFLQGQLYKLLIDSQWTVEEGGVFAGAVYWINVAVAVRGKENVPPAAIALVNQLRSNGIESFLDVEKNPAAFVLEKNPVTKTADFIVRVGDQPPNNNK